ncbi:hypothetical protein GCM10010346_04920 [Streptomyces chryseus]|uniref:Uncharacterized protein n=1 Tax=Streptomyces chryseus TaxID=68186 RepID=A0ABQ3DGP8_9ACTN|nr:hypothetical protein GCM10010346_04920 [Streptomyces chryseus]
MVTGTPPARVPDPMTGAGRTGETGRVPGGRAGGERLDTMIKTRVRSAFLAGARGLALMIQSLTASVALRC